jgi:hypothetical protein
MAIAAIPMWVAAISGSTLVGLGILIYLSGLSYSRIVLCRAVARSIGNNSSVERAVELIKLVEPVLPSPAAALPRPRARRRAPRA